LKRYVYGPRAVLEALSAHAGDAQLLLVTEACARLHPEAIALAESARVPVALRPPGALDALSGGVRHQGVVCVLGRDYPYHEFSALLAGDLSRALFVALDEVTDPHNLGAIVRSAVAFGAAGVVTLRDRAAPVNPTVVRASAGATEHCRIARVTNLARALESFRAKDVRVVGLDAEGSAALEAVDLTGPVVLVVGSEGRGLRRLVREGCDVLARLPLDGPIASLNASVAAAVALYEVTRQRRAP
jgi:23S rRNA (guanosine2251-2'-O)-methyltransferase